MPDYGFIKFSPPGLEDIAGQLADILESLTASVEKLHTEVVAARASWEGEARGSFDALMEEWKRQDADLRALQKGLHGGVTSSHATFVSAHAAVSRAWGA